MSLPSRAKAVSPPSFEQHATRLAAGGYKVIPISRVTDRVPCPGKQPAQRKGWQEGCPETHWKSYAGCCIGILTRFTPAIDVDVLEEEFAVRISDLATAKLGDAPLRIGQPPKRLMPYRLEGEPFKKIKLTWWGVAHGQHTPERPPGVEILADGQQFVALGIHPSTRQPYTWQRDPFLSIPRDLLPALSYAKAERFMRSLAGALERIGATHIKLSGVRNPETLSIAEAVAPRGTGGHPAADFLRKVGSKVASRPDEAERIRDALERMGNDDLHYGDWIKIGHALKAALPGNDGLQLWLWWSAKSGKHNPVLTRKKWATFDPKRVTAATIFWQAAR